MNRKNPPVGTSAMRSIDTALVKFPFPLSLGLTLLLPLAAGSLLKAQSQPPAAPILHLQDAVSLALQKNRGIQIAALELRKSQEQVSAARTQRFPSFNTYLLGAHLLAPISFQFPQGVFGTFSATGPIPPKATDITTPARFSTFVFVQGAQPLSQLYKINLAVKLRELSSDFESEQLRRERQEVVNEVKRIYYEILGTQSALNANEASLEALRELESYVGQLLLQETVLKVDRLEVETRLALQEYSRVTLRNNLATQKEQLNHLLGRDLETEFSVESVPETTDPELDLAEVHAKALAQRPEIRMAELGVRQAEHDVRLKRAEYIPDVSLTVSYLSPYLVEVVPHNIATAGLQFSWEPFDWGRRRDETRAKELAVEQQRQKVEDARSQVLAEVNERLRKLHEAGLFLEVARLTQETAEERLRVSTNGFKQRVLLWKDVLQHQSSLADANDEYQKALLGFWSAKADFDKATGEEQ